MITGNIGVDVEERRHVSDFGGVPFTPPVMLKFITTKKF